MKGQGIYYLRVELHGTFHHFGSKLSINLIHMGWSASLDLVFCLSKHSDAMLGSTACRNNLLHACGLNYVRSIKMHILWGNYLLFNYNNPRTAELEGTLWITECTQNTEVSNSSLNK